MMRPHGTNRFAARDDATVISMPKEKGRKFVMGTVEHLEWRLKLLPVDLAIVRVGYMPDLDTPPSIPGADVAPFAQRKAFSLQISS
jgi:hypothetical protein